MLSCWPSLAPAWILIIPMSVALITHSAYFVSPGISIFISKEPISLTVILAPSVVNVAVDEKPFFNAASQSVPFTMILVSVCPNIPAISALENVILSCSFFPYIFPEIVIVPLFLLIVALDLSHAS